MVEMARLLCSTQSRRPLQLAMPFLAVALPAPKDAQREQPHILCLLPGVDFVAGWSCANHRDGR